MKRIQRDLALSATAFGLAYYRMGTYVTPAAEPAVTGPDSREEVRRSVHALTTDTVGVSLVQSIGQNIVVGVTPKFVWGAGSRKGDVDAGLMVWVNHIRFDRRAQPDDAGFGDDSSPSSDREVVLRCVGSVGLLSR